MFRNTTTFHYRIPPGLISLLHNRLEGIEGVGVVRTVAPDQGLIKVWVAPDFEDEFLALMVALREELRWEPVDLSPPLRSD